MGEAEPAGRPGHLDHQAGLQGLLQGLEHLLLGFLEHAGEDGKVEVAPDDRGHSERPARRLGQALHPPPDHLPHALGDAEVGRVPLVAPSPVLLTDGPDLGQVAQDLDEEEGVAVGLPV